MPILAEAQSWLAQQLSILTAKPKKVAIAATCTWLVWFVGRSIYRLYFHPLAKFPGPVLARTTRWYEIYYDIWRDGQMEFKLQEDLHPKYGRIVRYNPNRLRVNDPSAFFEMYRQTSPLGKDIAFYAMFGFNSLFNVKENSEHRIRRSLLNPAFSKQRILKAEGMVKIKLAKMVRRLEGKLGERGVAQLNLHNVAMCTALDTYTQFAFAYDIKALDYENFDHPFIFGIGEAGWMLKHFPTLMNLPLIVFPDWFNKILIPTAALYVEYPKFTRKIIDQHIEKHKQKVIQEKQLLNGNGKAKGHSYGKSKDYSNGTSLKEEYTILDSLLEDLDPFNLPEHFHIDVHTTFGASFSTSAGALNAAYYYLSENPELQDRLFRELKQALPTKDSTPSYNEIEKLPYLTAVLKETLRMGVTIMGALPRVTPPGGFDLNGEHIPENTIIEHSIYAMHFNETTFPNAHKFIPERWMVSDAETKRLDKYLVAFGAGNRMCLGMHMAYLQMYLTLATVFRRWEIGLSDRLKQDGYKFVDRWVCAHRTEFEYVVMRRPE